MELGLFLSTHGVTNRDDRDWWHQPQAAEEMKPVESARLAEQLGFHSVWMGDHVALPEESPESVSPLHVEGVTNPDVRQRGPDEADIGGSKRHYPARPNILDGAVVMGAIASATTRIKMGPSVLIAPYRHPLSDARQFMTIDFLSNGRLIMGVGCGWMKEEFEALGHDFHAHRLEVLDECIQIYDRAWREGTVSFSGRHYEFDNVGVYPLTVRKPRPPIVVGATTKAGARLAARRGDGLLPLLTRPNDGPHDADHLQEEIHREAERVGRDSSEIAMIAFVSARVTDPSDPEASRNPRSTLGGTPEQILTDVERFSGAGYSLVVVAPTCASRTYSEFAEQVERLGREVLPHAKSITPKGNWRRDI